MPEIKRYEVTYADVNIIFYFDYNLISVFMYKINVLFKNFRTNFMQKVLISFKSL
jgi:hypothetical protein